MGKILNFVVLGLVILPLWSSLGSAQNYSVYDGPGFEASYPENHMLFLKGDEDIQFLDRNWTTITGLPSGSATFSKTSSAISPLIVQASSAAIMEPFRFEGNVSIHLFASLETNTQVCSVTNIIGGTPVGSETQFEITLSMGNVIVASNILTNSMAMENDRTELHEFLVSIDNLNVSMSTNDVISLEIRVRHECAISGTLWWGTYDARSGIILEGDLIVTELEVLIDKNRMVRIEFTPISPWGPGDFSEQFIELIGPMDWSEMRHGYYIEDVWQDHFETPQGFNTGESNRTVLTWTTEKPLGPGNYMLDACFVITDQDPGDLCDSWAILRFNVPEDNPPLADSKIAAVIVVMGMIAWLVSSLRGATLPLPAYLVILVLAISCVGPASDLPDLSNEPFRESGAVPSFLLLSHDPNSPAVSLSELMEESDVIVVGMFTYGSPNAITQMNDFKSAELILKQDGIDPSFAQIAIGEGLLAINLNEYASTLNGSWPLLIDDSTVGQSFPSGPTDAVIVIDSAGFVIDWKPGSMSPAEISSSAKMASLGSGKSPLDIFAFIFGSTLLPLFVLSMPSERKLETPEEALIPGVGGFMTIGASSIGFLFCALPLSILSSVGLGQYWIFIEITLSLVLIYHGFSIFYKGRIFEIEVISKLFHSNLPIPYREWRPLARFSEDVYIGLWAFWLIWLNDPSMIPQGVGSLARSGLLGALISPVMLLGFSICAGMTVLLIRVVVLMPGQFSRVFGLLSVGIRPRAWGIAIMVFGSWLLTSIIIGPIFSTM